MHVPRGKVDAEFHAQFPAGRGDFPDQVSLSSLVRRTGNIVIRPFGGPHAEPVMMLRYKDHSRYAGILKRFYPGTSVQPGRIEHSRLLLSGSPFHSGKRVHAEMDEAQHFPLLVIQLAAGGPYLDRHIHQLFPGSLFRHRDGYAFLSLSMRNSRITQQATEQQDAKLNKGSHLFKINKGFSFSWILRILC